MALNAPTMPHLLLLHPYTPQFLHLTLIPSPTLLLSPLSLSLTFTSSLSTLSAHFIIFFPTSSMEAKPPDQRRNSNTLLLEELEALSQSLYQSHTSPTRRSASLTLPRSSAPSSTSSADPIPTKYDDKPPEKPRSRRMSLSPWRSRPKLDDSNDQKDQTFAVSEHKMDDNKSTNEKKGIWNWKPIRALSHIGMQKLSCLFSVEVVAAESLPASMNGLRLSVCVRKKETKDGAVQTMPARVLQGAADFEEILFVRCHVYCSMGSGKQQQQQMKFEPRPFLIYAFAVDAYELDFGRSSVDLSLLVQESMEKNLEGMRVRQWDKVFSLSGKAKGGRLVVKLGFQIMEKDGGLGIYSQVEGLKGGRKGGDGSSSSSSSFARKQSKLSFSAPSPRLSSRRDALSPSKAGASADFQGIDEFNLDEPAHPNPPPNSSAENSSKDFKETESKMEDLDLPEFEVVDKGVEFQERRDTEKVESEEASEERSVSSEVVKEIVQDPVHLTRLTELDSIAQQIKALESMMEDGKSAKSEEETNSQRLDADVLTVTREFLQMLEAEEANEFKLSQEESKFLTLEGAQEVAESESEVFLPDLGKGLGCVVQTKDGGYLAAMNPFDVKVPRKDAPKLAMQFSRPLILKSQKSASGFEVFQSMAAIGLEELSSEILSSMPIYELLGKTAEQTAFEGIASAIIQGRNKEGATSSAARSIAAVKAMSNAMTKGRKERILTGIWNVDEDPVPIDEILAFSMQKIEAMAVEALKIQADMADEDAPFDVSPLIEKSTSSSTARGKDANFPLASAIPLEDWLKNGGLPTTESEPGAPESITISVTLQLRDPLRRYEAVGGPLIILIQATHAEAKAKGKGDDEERFKIVSLHFGGLKVRSRGRRSVWDTEKQRLTAMQWLVAYGLGKAGKKGKHVQALGPDCLWSISSRVMVDMWLKSMRNPDVKFAKQL